MKTLAPRITEDIITGNRLIMYRFFKWLLITFFLSLIVIKVYLSRVERLPIEWASLFVLLVLIFIIIRQHRITWYLAIVLFLYGIFNVIFIGLKASVPTVMEFTSPLQQLIYNDRTGSTGRMLIGNIPLFFYFIGLVILTLNPTRRYYKVGF